MKTCLMSLLACGAIVLLSGLVDAQLLTAGGDGSPVKNYVPSVRNTGCSAKGPPFSELDFVYKDYGPFWARKVKTFFRQLAAGSGICTKQSYLTLGKRIVDFEKLGELPAKQLLLKFAGIFDAFFGEFAVNGGVDEATYVNAVRKNQIYLRDAAGAFYALWFDLMDRDGDGLIGSDDFKLFNRMFTIDESLAADTFKVLDSDHDGKISQGEFVNIGNQYWLTEDQKLSVNALHGPLAK